MALTLKMPTAQVVEASALSGTVNISHIQDYVHPVDDAQLTSFYLSLMFTSKKTSFSKHRYGVYAYIPKTSHTFVCYCKMH